jgi:methionine sulfoxide reductase heme-binding subunit
MTASPVDWYAARAAGIVAYVLLTGGVLLGTLLAGRVRVPRWPAFAVTDVHRFVSLLVGVFVSLHVLAIWLDSYVHFSLAQIVVPGASSYRPLWVALGIVAAELLLAIAVTNLLRRRIGHRRWRRVHYLTFLVWAGATVHGLGAGTDSSAAWLRLLYVLSIASVLGAVVWRVGRSRLPAGSVLAPSTAAVLFGFVLVLGLGKLPSGIGRTQSARAATSPPGRVSDTFAGSVEQQQGPGGALVSVVGRGTGQRRLLVRIDLVTPDGSRIADTALQVRDVVSGTLCTGTVTAVGGGGFAGSCSFPGGAARTVSGAWSVSGRSVSGRLTLSSRA